MFSITFAEHSIPNPSISCICNDRIFYHHCHSIYQYSIDSKTSVKLAASETPVCMEVLSNTHLVVVTGNVLKIFDLKNFSTPTKEIRLSGICNKFRIYKNSIAFLDGFCLEIFSLNLRNLVKIDLPEKFLDFDSTDQYSYFLSAKGYIIKARNIFDTKMFNIINKLIIIPNAQDSFVSLSIYQNSVILSSKQTVNKYELHERSVVLQYTLNMNVPDIPSSSHQDCDKNTVKEKFVLNTNTSAGTSPSSCKTDIKQMSKKMNSLSLKSYSDQLISDAFGPRYKIKDDYLLSDQLILLSKAPFLAIDEPIHNISGNVAISDTKIYYIKQSSELITHSLTYDTANYSVFVNSKDVKVPELIKDSKQIQSYVGLMTEIEKYKKIAEKISEIEKNISARESQLKAESEAVKLKVDNLEKKKAELSQRVQNLKIKAERVKFVGDKTGFTLKMESLKNKIEQVKQPDLQKYKQRLLAIKALICNKMAQA